MTQDPNLIEILLVDDNPGDVRLTQEILKECKILNNLHVARDGQEALDFLLHEDGFGETPVPDIVFLDLNLPKVDGREVLAKIKSHPDLHRIPVVVLTTSRAEEDVLRSYNLHANCYVTKPLDIPQFIRVVRTINHFWFSVVTLPKQGV